MDPTTTRAVEALLPEFRELFEERAGIMEFDAGLPRAEAERRALEDIQKLAREGGANAVSDL